MDMAFIKALNMSISASWLVLAVLVLRLLLKKSPKWISVALWALVAVRLVCPISIESAVSLVPSTHTVPEEIFYFEANQQGENVTLEIVSPRPNVSQVNVETGKSVNNAQTWEVKWSLLWPTGMVIMLTWAWISYFRLKKKVDASIDVGNGVFICDYIDTPFILGIVKPKIYLPSAMEPDSAAHVLAHERAHIARKDHWWKPFGYLLLSVYWFNPVLWLAYILLCRDIELACDEKVIRDMELPQKKAYSEALLSCSINRRMIAACPLAFGEVGVKERVKTVLNYKKPAFWIVIVAILALIVTAVCFLTDPVKEEPRTYRVEEVVYRNPVLSYYMTEENAPQFQITGDNILRSKEHGGAWKDLGEFSQIKMSDLDFEELFFGLLEKPREDNQEVWMLAVPPEETANSTPFYLLFRQENGVLYLGEGIAFTNVYPLHENIMDATCNVNWLYRLKESDSDETGENVSPYTWTSTVESGDILAHAYGGATYSSTFQGSKLDELLSILNGVKEDEIVSRKPEGKDDPLWNYDATWVDFTYADGMWVWIRYVDDTVIIGTESNSDVWKTDGYWVIENEMLTQWMEKVANGGTYMLSDENRAEIRQLLQMEQVQFFDPKEYDDFLFVGCAYDNGRGLGVAVFQKVANGYELVVLLRDEDVKKCASGSELYYCEYSAYRIFLVLNRNVTGMEWAGAHEATYAIDTHPGLVVEYFPENLDAMYRFNYGGGATTMYMDWENQTHANPGEHVMDDPLHIFPMLNFTQLDAMTLGKTEDVDAYYRENSVRVLNQNESSHVLYLLTTITESDMVPGTIPFSTDCYLIVSFQEEKTGNYRSIRFEFEGSNLYYSYMPDESGVVDEFWKIDSPQLVTYIKELYDKSDDLWKIHTKYPKADGGIFFEVNGVKVCVPKFGLFEYELTEQGIRFKPEDAETWVELQYLTEPFAVCGTGLKSEAVEFGRYSGTKGIYDDNVYWSFLNLQTVFGGATHNIVLLNDDTWVEEYKSEIRFLLNWLDFQVME